MSAWSACAMCRGCWHEREPEREPVVLRDEYRHDEMCAWCGRRTRAGIYVRAEWATLPYGLPDRNDA